MNVRDPNLERVELVATALGPLRDELVFVGGYAAGLLMSDQGATPIRATVDVDLANGRHRIGGYPARNDALQVDTSAAVLLTARQAPAPLPTQYSGFSPLAGTEVGTPGEPA